MLYNDTIAAIATPVGEGGVGMIRLSGGDALPILQRIFRPMRGGANYKPQMLRYGHLIDPEGHTVDEAMAVLFRAPRSYTRENVVEIHCHGGPLPLRRALELALEQGARLAEPGEFTLRAFLNGRIDLAQAEATLDLIQARTQTGMQLALNQIGGRLSHEVQAVRNHLIGALAYLTALIDFPEDDVPEQEVLLPLRHALNEVAQLYASADQGILYRYGARAVLVGRPNAGKSSLLNALLQVERAIVTPIAGTTRDTLEETANLGGVPVVLIDTAGITETDDPVERIGVERSQRALRSADIVLLVLDQSAPLAGEDKAIAALTYGRPTVAVFNKADLSACLDPAPLLDAHPSIKATVATSAATGEGLNQLGHTVASVLLGGSTLTNETLVTNPRHRDALGRSREHLHSAVEALEMDVPLDLVAVDVTAAVQALGEVTGETVGEDLLATIFSRFCIGK
jgi:tRNA modification GTPase